MTSITKRNALLRGMLTDRRADIQNEVQTRIRNARGHRTTEVRDDLETSDAGMQGDMDLALLQMRAEMLTRIDAALARLDAGTYGSCFECGREIAEARLRALPFAARCQACEGRREQHQGRARQAEQRRDGLSLFPDMLSS